MKSAGRTLRLVAVVSCAASASWRDVFAQNPRFLSLAVALQAAHKNNPDMSAARERIGQAGYFVDVSRAAYFPTVDFESMDSFGFPGSTGSSLLVQGLMGSPFRSGPAAGLVSKLELFDLERGYQTTVAESRLKSAREQARLTRLRLDEAVLAAFLEVSRDVGQQRAWRRIAAEARRVQNLVDRFVRNGRHSVVSAWLVQDQVLLASTSEKEYAERRERALRRLSLLTGLETKALILPDIADVSETDFPGLGLQGSPPLVAVAQAEAAAAHARLSVYKARNFPKVLATASVGTMNGARLVPMNDYAGGFALAFPVFEGGRIRGEIKQAEAFASEKDQALLSFRLALDELNSRYDETIAVEREDLSDLRQEDALALATLHRATRRYLSFIGALVDVREALRNLARVETRLNDARADYLFASGAKALVNGASVPD